MPCFMPTKEEELQETPAKPFKAFDYLHGQQHLSCQHIEFQSHRLHERVCQDESMPFQEPDKYVSASLAQRSKRYRSGC